MGNFTFCSIARKTIELYNGQSSTNCFEECNYITTWKRMLTFAWFHIYSRTMCDNDVHVEHGVIHENLKLLKITPFNHGSHNLIDIVEKSFV